MFKKQVSWSFYSFWSETQVQGQLWDTGLGEKEDYHCCPSVGIVWEKASLWWILIWPGCQSKCLTSPFSLKSPGLVLTCSGGDRWVFTCVWLCGRVLLQGSDLNVYLRTRILSLALSLFLMCSSAGTHVCMRPCMWVYASLRMFYHYELLIHMQSPEVNVRCLPWSFCILLFFKTGSVLELRSWALGSSLGWTGWHLPISVLQHWGYRWMPLHRALMWGSNPSFHFCIASTLPTLPSASELNSYGTYSCISFI